MDNIVRVDFEERDTQWIVTLIDADGNDRPGEPFPASGHERFTKLEQVTGRLAELGLRPKRTPYDQPNKTHYVFEVDPT